MKQIINHKTKTKEVAKDYLHTTKLKYSKGIQDQRLQK